MARKLTGPEILQQSVDRLRRKGSAALSVNLAQFHAQRYERSAVDNIAGLFQDFTQPARLRLEAAVTLLTIARGKPREWLHDGQTIDPTARLESGETVEQGARVVDIENELHLKLYDLVKAKVHPDEWPDSVKRLVADTELDLYADEAVVIRPEEEC
jgi:hypothetical protein